MIVHQAYIYMTVPVTWLACVHVFIEWDVFYSGVRQVLTFKEINWQSLRIEADAIESDEQDLGSTPLRLITNQGRIRIALKRRVHLWYLFWNLYKNRLHQMFVVVTWEHFKLVLGFCLIVKVPWFSIPLRYESASVLCKSLRPPPALLF